MTLPAGYSTTFEWGGESPGDDRIVPSPNNPMAVARQFVAEHYIGDGRRRSAPPSPRRLLPLRRRPLARGEDRRVTRRPVAMARAGLLLEGDEGRPELVPFEPNKYKIANVLEALKAIGHIAQTVQPPVWLDGDRARPPINAGEIVPLANGILDFSTRASSAAHAGALRAARAPVRRTTRARRRRRAGSRFLDELWGDDERVEDDARASGSATSSRATPSSRRCSCSSARSGPARARSPAS